MKHTVIIAAIVVSASSAGAESPSFTQATKHQWDQVKGLVMKSAEQMPEADYAFKPIDTVRNFGQIVAHIADGNGGLCAMAAADKSRSFGDAEKTKTSKTDIIAALKESYAYCDAVYAKMNDTSGAEAIQMFDSPTPKLSVLAFNNNHVWEHYGNIVTYLRLKGRVPPSSQSSQ